METNKDNLSSILPLMALDDIPNPNQSAKDIVALKKEKGQITGYQLSDGSVVNKEHGVELAKQGQINGVAVAHNKDTEYLKSIPDSNENSNLGNLPSISDPAQNNNTNS